MPSDPSPNTDPVELSVEQRREVADKMATCPFVGTAVATGLLPVLNTAEHPLANIDAIAALGDSGGGNLGSLVLKLFARGNHSRWLNASAGADAFVPRGTFSLQFGGSSGAHPGHSGILLGDPNEIGAGRFDAAAFERLAQHADQDGRLSSRAVGRFIADNLKRDPKAQVLPALKLVRSAVRLFGEFRDVVLSHQGATDQDKTEAVAALTQLLGEDHLIGAAGEWGLLFAFLKKSPHSRQDGIAVSDIALSDVQLMFVDKQFPAGWDAWEKSALDWVKATLTLVKDASLAYHASWLQLR